MPDWAIPATQSLNGTLYTMGADDETEYLIALNADTGYKLWQTPDWPAIEKRLGRRTSKHSHCRRRRCCCTGWSGWPCLCIRK